MKARTNIMTLSLVFTILVKVMFQGKHAEHIARQFCTTDSVTNSKSSKADDLHNITYNDYNCIGSDEAGSGDYFGPLTVCAAFVSKEHIDI